MEERTNDAAVKDALIKGGVCIRHGAKIKVKLCSSEGCTNKPRHEEEECALSMGQRSNDAQQ